MLSQLDTRSWPIKVPHSIIERGIAEELRLLGPERKRHSHKTSCTIDGPRKSLADCRARLAIWRLRARLQSQTPPSSRRQGHDLHVYRPVSSRGTVAVLAKITMSAARASPRLMTCMVSKATMIGNAMSVRGRQGHHGRVLVNCPCEQIGRQLDMLEGHNSGIISFNSWHSTPHAASCLSVQLNTIWHQF